MPPSLSVHPGVGAALASDAGSPGASPVTSWLVGCGGGTIEGGVRVLGSLCVADGGDLANDAAAADALLPGGLFIVGAAGPVADAALAAAEPALAALAAPGRPPGVVVAAAQPDQGGSLAWFVDGRAAPTTPDACQKLDPWLRCAFSVAGGRAGAAAAEAAVAGPGAVFLLDGEHGGAPATPLAAAARPGEGGAWPSPARVRLAVRGGGGRHDDPPPTATFAPSPAADAVADDAAGAGQPPAAHWASAAGGALAAKAAGRGARLSLDALALCPRPGDENGGAAAAHALRAALLRQVRAAAACTAPGQLRCVAVLPDGAAFPVCPVVGAGGEGWASGLAARLRVEPAALLAPGAALAPPAKPGRAAAAGPPARPPAPARPAPEPAPLRNLHARLRPPSAASPLTVATVSGDVDYFHYGMGRTDDAGWGCAYRAGQTLAAWLAAAGGGPGGGGVAPPPPTHAQFQAALVELGDKPPSFLGSKAWIGAAELGFALDRLVGAACRIIPVRAGEDVGSRPVAAALASHFRAHGSPVMVGGGQLAYTCLGVAYDEGDEASPAWFLIADPHYAGPPGDADAVLGGGWVAWRRAGAGARSAGGGPLFEAGAHYNLLCPQRPR